MLAYCGDMRIVEDDLCGLEIQALLREHFADMHTHSPADSCHVLELDELRGPRITVWSAWIDDTLAGCGALQELDVTHGEIKSMRTADAFLRRGVAASVLEHLLGAARARGYRRLSLETGAPEHFLPARRLYERYGFAECPPFADYVPDPFSVFMTREL